MKVILHFPNINDEFMIKRIHARGIEVLWRHNNVLRTIVKNYHFDPPKHKNDFYVHDHLIFIKCIISSSLDYVLTFDIQV